MHTSVLISTFAPFPTLALAVPTESSFADLYDLLADRYPSFPLHSDDADLVLTQPSGSVPDLHSSLSSLLSVENDEARHTLISLRLVPRLRGGKGGFGSQLRAAGGRMSSQKTSNTDSCRDLSGRRLRTIKEAKGLADQPSESELKRAQLDAQKEKLEALERKLANTVAGQKRPLDSEYVEQSREIVDGVKSAVSVAMLRKKKKAKTSKSPPADAPSSSVSATVPAATEKGFDAASNVSKTVSATVPAVAAVAVAIGVASA